MLAIDRLTSRLILLTLSLLSNESRLHQDLWLPDERA